MNPFRRTVPKLVLAALLALLLLARSAPARQKNDDLRLVHVLVVIDTNTDLKNLVLLDLNNLQPRITGNIPRERLDLKIMQGDEVSRAGILRYYNDLKVGPNEGIVFWYSGHGAFDKRPGFGHALTMGRTGTDVLFRSELRAAMERKNAALTVLLTNCCSNEAKLEAKAPVGAAPAGSPDEISPVWRCLFFQSRGVVDITAAEQGSFALLDTEVGGMFTRAFLNLMEKGVDELDLDKDGFVSWDEFYKQLREETNRVFKERKETWGAGADEIKQDGQFAFAFNLPKGMVVRKPIPLPPGVKGYKLGARVDLRAAAAAAPGQPRGVKLLMVTPGSPAAKAGLEVGDVILSVNDQPVNSLEDYASLLDGSGGMVRLQIIDGRSPGKIITVESITLEPIK
jgi:hypothetical protein